MRAVFPSFFRRASTVLILLSWLGGGVAFAARDVAPTPSLSSSPTFRFSVKEAGFGLGYVWGRGTLCYNGQPYGFEISGGGIVSLGFYAAEGQGTVKDLKRLDQFDGTYWTVGADAAIASGRGAASLENQYGVRLKVQMKARGAHLGASISRLRLKLIEDRSLTVRAYARPAACG